MKCPGILLYFWLLWCVLILTAAEEEKEGVPSKPLNLTVQNASSSTIELTWTPPERPNGHILGYRLYYMHSNFTDVTTVHSSKSVGPVIEYMLSDLKPYTEYKIWLKAFTWKNEGEPSEAVYHKTDVRGPSAPRIMNLTCQSNDTLLLQWQRPTEYYNTIDYYYISYRDDSSWDFDDIVVETSQEHIESMMMIPNLTKNVNYEIRIRAASRSIFDQKQLVQGQISNPRKAQVRQDCDRSQMPDASGRQELSAGMIAGVVCGSFALLLAVTSFVLWR